MKTQPKLIARAIKLGACKEGIEWAKSADADWKGIPYQYASWAACNLGDIMTDEQVDSVVLASPDCVANYLSKRTIDRFTDEHIDIIVENSPWSGISHLFERLKDKHVASIVKSIPGGAAEFLSHRLSDEQVAFINEADPWMAKLYLSDRIKK